MGIKAVDSLVKSTLEGIGVPVERLVFSGESSTRISFMLISMKRNEFADDGEVARRYLYRADVYSKTDYIDLVQGLESALEAAGFDGIEFGYEAYEPETRYYHIPIEFHYTEYEEGEG